MAKSGPLGKGGVTFGGLILIGDLRRKITGSTCNVKRYRSPATFLLDSAGCCSPWFLRSPENRSLPHWARRVRRYWRKRKLEASSSSLLLKALRIAAPLDTSPRPRVGSLQAPHLPVSCSALRR